MIDAKDLTMRIGTRELIVDAGFRVDKGMRVGLVGRNGAGKTTLIRLMAGEGVTSDVVEATGALNRKGTIGYLPQDTQEGDLDQAARDRILSVRGIDETIKRIRKAEREMSESEGPRQIKALCSPRPGIHECRGMGCKCGGGANGGRVGLARKSPRPAFAYAFRRPAPKGRTRQDSVFRCG